MKIKSNHITADEGKILRRKSDQQLFGNELYLGYTYYLGGKKLEVPLLELPEHYEEIDDPDYYPEEVVPITRRELAEMNRSISILSSFSAMSINTMSLDEETALEFEDLFPQWEDLLGKPVNPSFRFRYNGKLYEVIQSHTLQKEWIPGPNTMALYKVVTTKKEEESGTIDNPIAWEWGMELFEGKYYTDKDVLYKCTRSSGMPLSYNLSDLVGLNVEKIDT